MGLIGFIGTIIVSIILLVRKIKSKKTGIKALTMTLCALLCIFATMFLTLLGVAFSEDESNTSYSIEESAEYKELEEKYLLAALELEETKFNVSLLESDLKIADTNLNSAKKENESLALRIKELEEENKPLVYTIDNAVPVYEDKYVTISFVGCEYGKQFGKQIEQLVFFVDNKSDHPLSFQADAFALDGISLGYSSGSDEIAAKSKGKIRFETNESFPSMTPSTITGTISVIDWDQTLFGDLSYDAPFTNIAVK